MATTCSSLVEEGIEELLQGHDGATVDDQGEGGGQYLRLQRGSNILELQLGILEGANKVAEHAYDAEPLGQGQDYPPGRCSTELMHLKLHGEWIRRYWRTVTDETFPARQQDPTLETDIFERTSKMVESVTKTLAEQQIDESIGREFNPPWSSPVVAGPLIVRDHLRRHISLLGEQLAHVRWQQNNLVPIARIPPEILIDIFDLVLDEGQSYLRDDTNTLLSTLSRICRDWAGLIDNAPRLWSHISPYCSTMKHVAMALEQSKPFPLTLHFNEEEMVHMQPDRFFGAIKRHQDRWKVLDLRLCSLDMLHTLNSRFANVFPPRLERLQVSLRAKVTTAAQQMDPFEIDFIKGPWPDTLRHLSLEDIGIPSRSYAELRGLRTLEIWPRPRQGVVKIQGILRVLSDCPELEALVLGDNIVLGEQAIAGTLGLPVRLEHLRAICVHLPPAPLHALLRNVQAQNCTKFHIETNLLRDGGGTWTEVLLTDEIRPFIRTMESVLLSVSTVEIDIGVYTVKLETTPQDGEFKVHLRFSEGRTSEVGKWMADCLSLVQAPVTLDIVPRDTMWIESLPLMLSRFHSTVKLALHEDHKVCQHVLDFLGTPLYTDPAGFQHFPTPRLSSLVIAADCLPGIISMLERRYDRHGSTVMGARSLVGLSRLGLVGGNEDTGPRSALAKQLYSALPSCEIEWK